MKDTFIKTEIFIYTAFTKITEAGKFNKITNIADVYYLFCCEEDFYFYNILDVFLFV